MTQMTAYTTQGSQADQKWQRTPLRGGGLAVLMLLTTCWIACAAPPAGNAEAVTDAATVATAKMLCSKLLSLPSDKFSVNLTSVPESTALTGEVYDLEGHKLARFGLGREQSELWVAGFYAEQTQPAVGEPMDIAQVEARTKAIVSTLYPRWEGRNMLLTKRRETRYGRPASGATRPPPAYEFAWGESPRLGIRTYNEIHAIVLADTGAFLLYTARLADEPPRYPTIGQAEARKLADAAIKMRYQHLPRVRIEPLSAVCWVG